MNDIKYNGAMLGFTSVSTMKSFVRFGFIFAILALANALDKATTRVKNVHEACQADPVTHADEYLIERARMEPVDPTKVGLHTLCMNVKSGLQRENGDIDKDDLRRALSEGIHDSAKVDAIVDDCGVRNGFTAEEASVNLFRCIFGHENAYVHEWKPPLIRVASSADRAALSLVVSTITFFVYSMLF